jgi:hypothetical protein
MKLFEIKRRVMKKRDYQRGKGEIVTRTTEIKKCVAGIPYKTLYKKSKSFHSHLTSGRERHLFI